MIRLSVSSAAAMGLINMAGDALTHTAYLLYGEECSQSCAFCLLAKGGVSESGRLGRVSWLPYSRAETIEALQRGQIAGLQRVCLQGAHLNRGWGDLIALVQEICAAGLPLSVSTLIASPQEAADLFRAGAERISIALDVADPLLFARYKGGSFKLKMELILSCSDLWPGCISTHIICGLGETEQDLLSCVALLLRHQVTVALFAFTPLKGTALAAHLPPAPASYRRLQAASFLMDKGLISFEELKFSAGKLISFGIKSDRLKQSLQGGRAFQTSGCPGCNRPYYNERPGGTIYNYHRPLTATEKEEAFKLIVLPAGG